MSPVKISCTWLTEDAILVFHLVKLVPIRVLAVLVLMDFTLMKMYANLVRLIVLTVPTYLIVWLVWLDIICLALFVIPVLMDVLCVQMVVLRVVLLV